MASTAFTNTLLSSSSYSSLSSRSTSPLHGFCTDAFLPSRISFPNQRSHFASTLLKNKKNFNLFTTHCSLDVASAKDPHEEKTPIELRYAAYPTVMDINQIREILPHRFPFLLIDRVIEYTPGVSAVAIKNVTINDNFFPGHFPERPIMPGVLMVEIPSEMETRVVFISGTGKTFPVTAVLDEMEQCAMAQVGGLVMLQPEVGGSRDNFFFAGIDKIRFRKPVIAGDTLVMRMTLIKLQKRFGIAKMEGKAYVGGEVVCDGEFMMATGN